MCVVEVATARLAQATQQGIVSHESDAPVDPLKIHLTVSQTMLMQARLAI